MRLDHLLFRIPDGSEARVQRIEERYGSDHHPLVGVVRFGAAASARTSSAVAPAR